MYSWGIFLGGNRELSVQIEHWQEFSNNSAKNFVENSKREAIVSSLKKGLAYIKKTAYLENPFLLPSQKTFSKHKHKK